MSRSIITVTGPKCGSPHKATVNRDFDIFFVVSLNKLMNKQSSWLWFLMPRTSCHVTIVKFPVMVKIIANVKSTAGPKSSTCRSWHPGQYNEASDLYHIPAITWHPINATCGIRLLIWQRRWQQIGHISDIKTAPWGFLCSRWGVCYDFYCEPWSAFFVWTLPLLCLPEMSSYLTMLSHWQEQCCLKRFFSIFFSIPILCHLYRPDDAIQKGRRYLILKTPHALKSKYIYDYCCQKVIKFTFQPNELSNEQWFSLNHMNLKKYNLQAIDHWRTI